MIEMIERYLLLLAVGLVVIFVVLITPGDQPFIGLCGGMITGHAVGNLIWYRRKR